MVVLYDAFSNQPKTFLRDASILVSMKKQLVIFALASIAILLIGVLGSVANVEETAFVVSPSAPSIPAGQRFTINVLIEPDRPIAGAQLNLEFNSSLIVVDSVEEGNLFKQNGSNTIFNGGNIDNTAGVVSHVWGNILSTPGAPKNVSTPGVFAIVNVTAYRAGVTNLSLVDLPPIGIMAADSSGNPVPANVTNATIEIIEYPRYDVNQDGVVNILDVIIVGQHFGESV